MAAYGTSVDSTAPAEKVWKIWSDMSTWGDWNPNVSTMDWQGGFVDGSAGIMNTRAGQHHKMRLVDVVPGRSFALLTSVVPGTTFRFNCSIEPASGKTKISQTVEVKGPLGPLLGGMAGPAGFKGVRHAARQPGQKGRVRLADGHVKSSGGDG